MCDTCGYWARESDWLSEHHETCPKNPNITPENKATKPVTYAPPGATFVKGPMQFGPKVTIKIRRDVEDVAQGVIDDINATVGYPPVCGECGGEGVVGCECGCSKVYNCPECK